MIRKRYVLSAAFSVVFATAALVATPVAEAAPSANVQVELNAYPVDFPDAKPYINNDGRSMVPVRFVSQSLGYSVGWNPQQQQVAIQNGNNSITLTIGNQTALVNGKPMAMDTQPYILDNRTYVPLRFVSEGLGADVAWDGASRTAFVNQGMKPVISFAMQFLGVPYVFGGTSPSGFDCSGLVEYAYQHEGITLPRTAHEMYAAGKAVAAPEPGDLVFFTTVSPGASHVGIYIGNNQFISATSHGVRVENMYDSYWGPRYIGARSVD